MTTAGLDGSPHQLLRTLREQEPVSWLPALGGWLVTSHDLASRVMRDSELFTVDDPRFSTARVVGPSMLSLDGAEHARHRGPFTPGFSHAEGLTRLAAYVEAETGRPLLISVFEGNHQTTSSVHLARRETTVQPSPCWWSGLPDGGQ